MEKQKFHPVTFEKLVIAILEARTLEETEKVFEPAIRRALEETWNSDWWLDRHVEPKWLTAAIAKLGIVYKSWRPEVFVEGKWSGNALRFATAEEAWDNGNDLLARWYVPTDHRASGSNDPVNYDYTSRKLIAVPVKVVEAEEPKA